MCNCVNIFVTNEGINMDTFGSDNLPKDSILG